MEAETPLERFVRFFERAEKAEERAEATGDIWAAIDAAVCRRMAGIALTEDWSGRVRRG